MPSKPLPVSLPDSEFAAFDMLNFGSVAAPSGPARFGFQVDVTPSALLSQVVFALVRDASDSDSPHRAGFGVRVDLERGEIWDIVNGSGLIGWLEEPLGAQAGERRQPILFSLEIERIGSALLPKLQVGGEEWLYPAVRSTEHMDFLAVGGCKGSALSGVSAESALANASVWSEAASR